MKEEIREILYLAISLIIAACFLSIVLMFTNIGYDIAYTNDAKLAKNSRMEQQAEIYKYVTDGDLANTEKVLSGTDIVRFISKNTTRYKYRIYFTDKDFIDIEYGGEAHERARNRVLDLMELTSGTANADQYYTADMSLWSQQYLNNEIMQENVYGAFIPYVTRIDTDDVTMDLDEIVDNCNLVRFNFVLKN